MGFLNKSNLTFLGINIALAIVVAALLLTGLYVWLKGYTQHGVEVDVMDVRGMVVAEAEPLLSAQGLNLVVIDSTFTDKVPFGTIVEQDPKPDSHAKHGRSVYVTINATTKRQVVIPDLQDISYRQATTTLRGLGLVVDTIYDYEPSAFRDLVLAIKTDKDVVKPGDKLPVGSTVRLVVGFGRGTDKVEVPSVIGMTLQEARSMLLSHRLTVGAVSYDEEDNSKPQYIYRQTPTAGEQLIEGETVALRLSTDIEKAATGRGNTQPEEEESWF